MLTNLEDGLQKIAKNHPKSDIRSEPWVLDLLKSKDFGGAQVAYDCVPCLTKSRCRSGGLWLVAHDDFTSLSELARLQGLNPADLVLPADVHEVKIREMIGNSFTASVFHRLFAQLLPAVGLAECDDIAAAKIWSP